MDRIACLGSRLIHRAFDHGRSRSQKRRDEEDARYAREKIDVVELRPAPLAQNRRNLSKISLITHSQPLSLLCTKLPPEIRQNIYELVLGGSVTHLVHGKKRILMCNRSELAEQIDHGEQIGRVAIQETPYVDWIEGRNMLPILDQCSKNLLSLLRTCHAIYAEAIPVLYNSNVFTIASPIVLIYLHDYVLLPQRFSEIRHLNLFWTYFSDAALFCGRMYAPYDDESWTRLWDLIAGMNLRTLGIRLEYVGFAECSLESGWIQPLLKVKGVDRVGLKLEHRVGPGNEVRLNDMEKQIEKQWTSL